jgi:hypothetical protein
MGALLQARADREVCVDWGTPVHSPATSLAEFTVRQLLVPASALRRFEELSLRAAQP